MQITWFYAFGQSFPDKLNVSYTQQMTFDNILTKGDSAHYDYE